MNEVQKTNQILKQHLSLSRFLRRTGGLKNILKLRTKITGIHTISILKESTYSSIPDLVSCMPVLFKNKGE
ncbi:MAG: hypothetical protein EOM67_13745 [Spirochaetia bacterium]|nr:hypothetical protein [Spirochaetia bacterium]